MTTLRRSAPITSMSYLPALPPEWQPISHAVLANGWLAVIATDVDLAGEHRRICESLRNSVQLDPASILHELAAVGCGRIWTLSSTGTWCDGPIFPLETPFPKMDRFPDGRWLIVNSASEGANARVLSADGAVLDRFRLGIGVEHLAIGDGDCIWAGRDDQTWWGRYDWKVPGQQEATEGEAVICFSDGGTPLFLPAWPEEGGGVVAPYAMSVDTAGAWSCGNMHAVDYFPLVRFVLGKPTRWWRSDVKGSVAIATDGDHVLLAGGWEPDRLTLLALSETGGGEQAAIVDTWSMPLPPRSPRSTWASERPTLLMGRGDTIHLVSDQIWYRWRVRDLVAS